METKKKKQDEKPQKQKWSSTLSSGLKLLVTLLGTMFTCSLTRGAKQPITSRPLNALRHVDVVKTTLLKCKKVEATLNAAWLLLLLLFLLTVWDFQWAAMKKNIQAGMKNALMTSGVRGQIRQTAWRPQNGSWIKMRRAKWRPWPWSSMQNKLILATLLGAYASFSILQSAPVKMDQ